MRWYDPALGRFIQPDTLVPGDPSGAGDAQSFDRYAYVNNNPLKYTDPSGHCIAEGQEGYGTEQNQLCLGYAGFIYNDGLANPDAFAAKWRVSPEDWWKNIGEQPGLGADFMKPHFEQAYSAFCARVGLTCNPGAYVANPIPTSNSEMSIDGFVLGTGFGGGYGVFSGSGGIELVFSQKTGEIALVTYYGPGLSFGAGANKKAYFAILNNLNQLEDYAGGTWSLEGTASTPYGGVVGSRFWSTTPGGTNGWSIGYAPGARLSGSVGWSSYTLPWVQYNLTTNQLSFPQVGQVIQQIKGTE